MLGQGALVFILVGVFGKRTHTIYAFTFGVSDLCGVGIVVKFGVVRFGRVANGGESSVLSDKVCCLLVEWFGCFICFRQDEGLAFLLD